MRRFLGEVGGVRKLSDFDILLLRARKFSAAVEARFRSGPEVLEKEAERLMNDFIQFPIIEMEGDEEYALRDEILEGLEECRQRLSIVRQGKDQGELRQAAKSLRAILDSYKKP